jgi:hypothetical protein
LERGRLFQSIEDHPIDDSIAFSLFHILAEVCDAVQAPISQLLEASH